MSKYIIRIAETDAELKEYFRIRNEVFVEEQKIFPETDIDEHDPNSVHIIAVDSSNMNVVGVVRCYVAEGDTWFGGRLGALPDYRNGRVGSRLVRFAVSTAKSRGCRKFLAYIQPNNVRFFERLDWQKVGEPIIYQGIKHQMMEANLDSY